MTEEIKLFIWNRYYPHGGLNDLFGNYSTFEKAYEAMLKYPTDDDRIAHITKGDITLKRYNTFNDFGNWRETSEDE